jgi:hypothetical protein
MVAVKVAVNPASLPKTAGFPDVELHIPVEST